MTTHSNTFMRVYKDKCINTYVYTILLIFRTGVFASI